MASNHPESATAHVGLTLSQLLDRPAWDLPGWNGPSADAPYPIIDQLDDLDRSFAFLRRYRNATRPVHRLSPDLLALIFQGIVQEDSTDAMSSKFGACSWKYIVHVCWRWRIVGLAQASLWTRVSSHFDQAALACLERSVDAPLTVMIDPEATMEDAFMAALRPHFGRIRHLYIPCTFLNPDAGNMYETMSPLLQSPAPILETLYAYKVQTSSNCFQMPTVFNHETPRLTTLKLCRTSPNLDSISFASLRHLFVKGRKRYYLEMEISKLFKVLEACPHLEVFKSVKTRFVESSSSDELPMVRLDHLRLLEISRSSGSVISEIIAHIIAPRCATLLNVWLRGSFQFGIPDNLPPDHHLRDIKHLRVQFRGETNFMTLRGTTTAGNNFEISAGVDADSPIGEMITIAGPFFQTMMRTLDLALLEELTIADLDERSSAPVFPREMWLEVFRRTPLLQGLHIWLHRHNGKGYSRTALPALTWPDDITQKVLCPRLQTLTVVNDRTWSALQCYVLAQERSRLGLPLKKVSLTHKCYENVEDMLDTDIPELRKVVGCVDLEPSDTPELQFPEAPW